MLKLGHRGAPKAFPENTIASFQHAIELGADGIELDVHLSRDGEVMVIHDDTVNRTAYGRGKVSKKTCKELRALHLKGGGGIPTLEEVIEAVGKRCVFFIEIKSPDCGMKVVEIVEHFIRKGFKRENFWVISFDHKVVKEVKEKAPKLQTGATTQKMPKTLAKYAEAAKADAACPCIGYLTQAFVDDARARGLQLFVWTANTKREVAKAKKLKVDGIMTDKLSLLD